MQRKSHPENSPPGCSANISIQKGAHGGEQFSSLQDCHGTCRYQQRQDLHLFNVKKKSDSIKTTSGLVLGGDFHRTPLRDVTVPQRQVFPMPLVFLTSLTRMFPVEIGIVVR